MCGIIGYVGHNKIANNVLLRGLETLEYRGYDSAGIATMINNRISICKYAGKVAQLRSRIMEERLEESCLGIGHTRWATHGIPSQINAHPHRIGKITLVHNGIIENHDALRQQL